MPGHGWKRLNDGFIALSLAVIALARNGPTHVHIGSSTLGVIDEHAQRTVSDRFASTSVPRLSVEGYLIGETPRRPA